MYESSSEEEDQEIVLIRRPRNFRLRLNFHFLALYEFNERFRLRAENIEMISNAIGERLEHPTRRNKALAPEQQLLIALHWLGNGGQCHAVEDMHGVSKATVLRVLHKTVTAINEIILPEVIKWPSADEMVEIVERFHEAANMPMVIGCIDGTLIPIDVPIENQHMFVDRHGKHSINVMAVCGPNKSFYYINANWPGSVHDARALRNSSLFRRIEGGWTPLANGIILGDSAYPLRHWLIPPIIRDVNNPAQNRFLSSHKRTTRIIEQSFGILKEKFPCLNHLRVNPQFAANIVMTCATLCNIFRINNEVDFINEDDNIEEEENNNHNELPQNLAAENRLQELYNTFR